MSGGAGRIRTADTQFRKLLLYPSELQPLKNIVIRSREDAEACGLSGYSRAVAWSLRPDWAFRYAVITVGTQVMPS
jgi:hypothetical protein